MERLAFFNAQRLKHGHKKAIAFLDWLALENFVKRLPVAQPPGRSCGPKLAAGTQSTSDGRLFSFGEWVDPESLVKSFAFISIGSENAKTEDDVVGRRSRYPIAFGLRIVLPRAQQ